MESTSSKTKAKKRPKGPVMPRAGKTIEGIEYITTHTCPACFAVMETTGAGYPQTVCSRCTMPMSTKSRKVGG